MGGQAVDQCGDAECGVISERASSVGNVTQGI
jgi:hypothetical protein